MQRPRSGYGICRICGSAGKLTADHVPPRGVPKIGQRILHDLGLDQVQRSAGTRGKRFQGGVKFPSLCDKCNNVSLGASCDPEIIALAQRVDDHIRSGVYLDTLPICFSPARIGRAVVGHLLAAMSEEQILRAPAPLAFREYFSNPSSPFPTEARCFLWPHYSQIQFISIGHAIIMAEQVGICFTLKFYPLAFVIPWGSVDKWQFPGVEITALLQSNSTATSLVSLPMRERVRIDFPELPGETSMFSLLGAESIRYSRPFSARRS